MTEKTFHFLDVCRGRYLCEAHGGFCDGADNYYPSCPVCIKLGSDAQKIDWRINRVDRVLHQVNGLQKRSQRNASLISTLLAGLGAVALLSKLASPGGEQLISAGTRMIAPEFLQLGVAALVLTVGLYAASMAQVSVTKSGKFDERTVADWEAYLTKRFKRVELCARLAGSAFLVSILLICLALVVRIPSAF